MQILHINIWDRKPTLIPYYDNLYFLNTYLMDYFGKIENYLKYTKETNDYTITKLKDVNMVPR
jgi:hypothetical protein